MVTAKSQLKDLLAQNQVQITIDILRDLTQQDVDAHNIVVLQSGRWHKYLAQTQKRDIDSRDLDVLFNQIHVALTDVIDGLEDDRVLDLPDSFWQNLPKPFVPPRSQKKDNKTAVFISLGTLSIMTLLFLYFQLKNRPLSKVTVFVYEKRDKSKPLKRKDFFVIMQVRGESKTFLLGDNGEAIFENLTVGELVKIKIKTSEPFTIVNPDSNYIITENGVIDLEVKLKGLEKVLGVITTQQGEALEGVTVSIGQLTTVSDGGGNYKINIPDSLQSIEQTVYCSKKGYKTEKVIATPQAQKPLPIRMERL